MLLLLLLMMVMVMVVRMLILLLVWNRPLHSFWNPCHNWILVAARVGGY